MSLYNGARISVRVDSDLSEKFEVTVRMHQGSVLSPFLFPVVVDATVLASDGALNELLYAHDLVLMSETIKGLRNKLLKGKDAFESQRLKVNLGENKVDFQSVASHRMACLKVNLAHVGSASLQ